MGKLLQGINGPVSGKVGAVIGYVLDDVAVIRGLSRKRKKPFSELELNQQARFSIMNRFLVPLKDILNITFAHLAYRMKGFHKAFSYNVKSSILGFRPDLSIDYPTVLLSRGDLTKPESATVVLAAPDMLHFSWTNNSGKGNASATDKAFVALYEPENGHWFAEMDLANRSDSGCVFPLKTGIFDEKIMHAYLGFVAAEKNDASDSVYLGTVNVVSK
jgi:hypothetical protein